MSQHYTHVGKEALENAANKMPDLTPRKQKSAPEPAKDAQGGGGGPPPGFHTLRFRFARTMPEIPHWYVVRSEENETEYLKLSHRIAEEGIWEEWKGDGQRYRYLSIGPFKYWQIGQVINRAQADPQSSPSSCRAE